MIRFTIFEHSCSNDKSKLYIPHLVTSEYGLSSMIGDASLSLRLVDMINDIVYNDFARLMRVVTGVTDDLELSNLVQSHFGIACDPDEMGGRFRFFNSNWCLSCKNGVCTDYISTGQHVDLYPLHVTHNTWIGMSNDDRLGALENDIIRFK